MNTYFIIHTQIIGNRGGKITQKFVVLADSEAGAKEKALANAYEGSTTKDLQCTQITDIKCVSVA